VDDQAISDDKENDFAVPEGAQPKMPLPTDPPTIFLGGLFILASLAALSTASAIILPVVLAFVLTLMLQPAVHLLERLHIPRAIGALFTILLVIGGLVGFGTGLAGPAATWAAKLPEGLPRLVEHLRFLKTPLKCCNSSCIK